MELAPAQLGAPRRSLNAAFTGRIPTIIPSQSASSRHQENKACQTPKHLLGDKAYDGGELRGELNDRGTKPVIPNKSNRNQPFAFNKRLCKLRWRIEAAFNRLKDFRRIATRYDELARNYLASVCLVAALVWWL